MKYSLTRGEDPIETKKVSIYIGETRYDIQETIEGELQISKTNFDDGEITIKPSYANVIRVK